MSFDFSVILFGLFLGHYFTDFVFQTTAGIEDKKKHTWRSRYLYIHGLQAGGLAVVCMYMGLYAARVFKPEAVAYVPSLGAGILMAVFIALTHTAIDLTKVVSDKKDRPTAYALDQLTHLVVLLVAALYFMPQEWHGLQRLAGGIITTKHMVYAAACLLLTTPSSYFIGKVIKQFHVAEVAPTGLANDKAAQGNLETIQRGGMLIGIIERLLIAMFALSGSLEGVGWLLTGKSILRFGQKDESLRTEYVLIGTLLSTALALLVSILAKKLTT